MRRLQEVEGVAVGEGQVAEEGSGAEPAGMRRVGC